MIRYIVILFFCWSNVLYAQDQLRVQLIDANTKEALIGANVRVDSAYFVTNMDGLISFESDNSTVSIEASYVGYETLNSKLSLSPGEVYTLPLQAVSALLNVATITGSRYEKDIMQSVASISVLKPALISATNAPALNTILDKIPGVQIIDGQANIRGGSGYSYGAGSRVLLLVDDMPALQADAGRPNWSDIPVENISQVEVLKGASSVLYGAAALNGIIHVRTGYAKDRPTTSVSSSYTVFDGPEDVVQQWWDKAPAAYNVGITHKQKIGKLDLVTAGFYHTEDGVYKGEYTDRVRGNLNMRYRLNDQWTIGLQSVFNYSDAANAFVWTNPTSGAFIPFGEELTATIATRYYIDPSIQYIDGGQGVHKVRGRFYSINNENTNNQSNSSLYSFAEYQYQKRMESLDMQIVAGLSANQIYSNSELFSDTTFSGNNQAVYLQLEKTLFSSLTINVGGRAEFNTLTAPAIVQGITLPNNGVDKESQFISRFGLNYRYNDYSSSRMSWGQGYRYPTITEKFISTTVAGFRIFPNPALESEKGWSAEIGHRQGFAIHKLTGFADLSLFWSQYQNMTEFGFYEEDGDLGFRSSNIGDTDIKGLELEVGAEYALGPVTARCIGGYTFIDPTYQNFSLDIANTSSTDENILKYRSRHIYNADVQLDLYSFSLGFAQRYASHVEAIDNVFFTPVDFVFVRAFLAKNTTNYTITDFRLGYRYKQFGLSILLNNAFNVLYTKRPALFENPRNVGIRFSAQF